MVREAGDYEAEMDAKADYINDAIREYLQDNLQQIVEDNLFEVIKILERKGFNTIYIRPINIK